MPLYNYYCKTCGTTEEQFVFKTEDECRCEKCRRKVVRQFPLKMGPIDFGWPEGGITLEHAESKPIHLKTRQEAKKYEKENNVQLGCL